MENMHTDVKVQRAYAAETLVQTRSLCHKELKYLVNLSFSFLKPGKTTTS